MKAPNSYKCDNMIFSVFHNFSNTSISVRDTLFVKIGYSIRVNQLLNNIIWVFGS